MTPSSSSAPLPTQLTSGKCIGFVCLMQKSSFYFAYRKLAEAKIRLKMEIIPQIGLDIHFTDKLLNASFIFFKNSPKITFGPRVAGTNDGKSLIRCCWPTDLHETRVVFITIESILGRLTIWHGCHSSVRMEPAPGLCTIWIPHNPSSVGFRGIQALSRP